MLAETDLGNIKIQFVPKNELGIIDHLVILPDSSTVNNPLRVIENGKGSELVFTLFWMPNRTEEEFNQDAKLVENDLTKIKTILEAEQTTNRRVWRQAGRTFPFDSFS